VQLERSAVGQERTSEARDIGGERPRESSSIFADIQKLFPNKYMRLDLPLAVSLVLIQFDGASRQPCHFSAVLHQ
jgi:hypothetical protein